MKGIKIIVKKYGDGYVAYPVGLKGVEAGEEVSSEIFVSEMVEGVKELTKIF